MSDLNAALAKLQADLPRRSHWNRRQFLLDVIAGQVEPDERGCIRWPWGSWPNGYPYIAVEGHKTSVGRFVLIATAGPPPTDDATVGHAPHEVCGNTDCVSPAHLSWQTPAVNVRQRAIDRTDNRGMRHGLATLTDDDVVAIRERYAAGGIRQADLAAQYGVKKVAVSQIVRGNRWTHVGGPITRKYRTKADR